MKETKCAPQYIREKRTERRVPPSRAPIEMYVSHSSPIPCKYCGNMNGLSMQPIAFYGSISDFQSHKIGIGLRSIMQFMYVVTPHDSS